MKLSALLVGDVPPGPTTVTSTVPAGSAGLTAVIWLLLSTTRDDAAVAPKSTAIAPVKPEPVIVTLVLPDTGPEVGLTPETVGDDCDVEQSTRAPALVAVVVGSQVPVLGRDAPDTYHEPDTLPAVRAVTEVPQLGV